MSELEIKELIHRETRAWNTKDVNLLLTIFHPDMVWVWPKDADSHDPMHWITELGHFNEPRWRELYTKLFADFELCHNNRTIQKVTLASDGRGGFAVVDIDTLWRANTGELMHWKGRTCKTYSKTDAGWKMIHQTGPLNYLADESKSAHTLE